MAVIYFNGRVHTMDSRGSVAEAILEDRGIILATGSNDEILGCARPGTRKVDLYGMTVIPGLTDSHTHFLMFSLGLSRVMLEGVSSLESALQMVGEAVKSAPEGAWVLGGGFNKNAWEGAAFPNRRHLDSVCGDHPVALLSFDCHTIWVNSLALKICGIGMGARAPEGGRIDLDPHGDPTGIIGENAMPLIERCIPKPTGEDIRSAVVSGLKMANGLGLVGVHAMEGADTLGTFQRLEMDGALTLRACLYIPAANLEDAIRLGIRSGFGGRFLRVGGVKLFADGSLNSQTADMLEPYEGTAERGIPSISREELERTVGMAVRAGISAAIHAIGDAANRKVLDVLELYDAQSREAGLRHRVEHAQIIHPDDLHRFARTVRVASVQPVHATSDRYVADRLWGARAAHSYAFKMLGATGAVLAFGSDAPVETIDPLRGIFAAVARKREDEPGSRPWYHEHRVTVEQAVRAYTMGPAYASYSEDWQGSIEPGKVADFIALSRDIFSCEPEEILSTRVALNIVGGRKVHEA